MVDTHKAFSAALISWVYKNIIILTKMKECSKNNHNFDKILTRDGDRGKRKLGNWNNSFFSRKVRNKVCV